MSTAEFKSESDLCASFIEWVKSESGQWRNGTKNPVWTPYAETDGWDILLVADDGTQVGIEAKLRFNMKVLAQCLPDCWDSWYSRGPDFRAVLVPKADSDQKRICENLGLVLFTPDRAMSRGIGSGFQPRLHPHSGTTDTCWHGWNPAERCKLPDYIPDVQAGCPAPLRLTEWKVKALRVLATIDVRGYVTKKDFAALRIDSRAWSGTSGWLKNGILPGQYVRGTADFDKQHPIVYAEVLAEIRAEVAKEPPQPEPPQASMFKDVA